VDFLIGPSLPNDKPGGIRNIEQDFAAIIAPGLHLAFLDRQRVHLNGRTIFGERAARDVWVVGPGAFVILKALALRRPGENKDAYDLFYVLRHLEAGLTDIVRRLEPHADDASARETLAFLKDDFAEIDSVGPRRVAEFWWADPTTICRRTLAVWSSTCWSGARNSTANSRHVARGYRRNIVGNDAQRT
jgi:hypothetical protein